MELSGFEPLTSWVRSRRSPNWAIAPREREYSQARANRSGRRPAEGLADRCEAAVPRAVRPAPCGPCGRARTRPNPLVVLGRNEREPHHQPSVDHEQPPRDGVADRARGAEGAMAAPDGSSSTRAVRLAAAARRSPSLRRRRPAGTPIAQAVCELAHHRLALAILASSQHHERNRAGYYQLGHGHRLVIAVRQIERRHGVADRSRLGAGRLLIQRLVGRDPATRPIAAIPAPTTRRPVESRTTVSGERPVNSTGQRAHPAPCRHARSSWPSRTLRPAARGRVQLDQRVVGDLGDAVGRAEHEGRQKGRGGGRRVRQQIGRRGGDQEGDADGAAHDRMPPDVAGQRLPKQVPDTDHGRDEAVGVRLVVAMVKQRRRDRVHQPEGSRCERKRCRDQEHNPASQDRPQQRSARDARLVAARPWLCDGAQP